MSVDLEIEGGGGTFRFDVPPIAFEPRLEPTWKEAADPPEVAEIREVWEVRGARLLSPDGDPLAFWARWTAFLAQFRVRGAGFPVRVRLVRVVLGVRHVVWTLGPPSHERFRIEQLGAGPDEVLPRATWRVLAPVTLAISAVQRFADANGIVGWEQETSARWDPGGLHLLEWRTRITTKEGTSAVDKARRFGRIVLAPFGPSYSYDTNGPDGVEVSAIDADEQNARVPTVAVAVSRIRQWGVHVGTTGPGTSPTEVGYSVRTKVDKGELTTQVRATARGPGALAWVEGRQPGGSPNTSEVFHEEATRYAEGTWTFQEQGLDSVGPWKVETEITGGHEDVDYEPTISGYEPVLFVGGVLPWKLTVHVRAQRILTAAAAAVPTDLLLPGVLPEPWVLDRNASRERGPHLAEEEKEGTTKRQWVREAFLTYWSAQRPKTSPLRQLETSTPVASYYLDKEAR